MTFLSLADARNWFLRDRLSAAQIAARAGLSVADTRALLTNAVLLPLPPPLASPAPDIPRTGEPILDQSQQAAAAAAHGPLLLGAGPGTGKTKTLVARCLHLTRAQNVLPENILALTFSNKAAQEMRERLIAAGVGTEARGPWVGTFHAFGLELLRQHGDAVGLPPDFTLLDPFESAALLEDNLGLLALDELDNLHNPALNLSGIVKAISRAKDELCDPARYLALAEEEMLPAAARAAADLCLKPKPLQREKDAAEKLMSDAKRARETAHCYAVYQQLLAERGAADYGDLISRSVALLQNNPEIRRSWQAWFPHILADEYQDVNRACAHLVRLLAGETAQGLWAVGDHRQSIYRFRGASPANVAAFEQDYPGGVRQDLAVNYRSAQPIVDCFGTAALHMGAMQSGTVFDGWHAHRGTLAEGALPPVTFAVAPDEDGQAQGLADTITLLHAEGRPLRDMALLCAAHRHASALSAALAARHIPVLYLGSLLDRPEIKDLLAVLALAAGGEDTAFLRAVGLPEYGLSLDTTHALLPRIQQKRVSDDTSIAKLTFAEALTNEDLHDSLPPETTAALTCLAAHLKAIRAEYLPADALKRYLFDDSDFLRHLPDDINAPFARTQQFLAVFQLMEMAERFALPQEGLEKDAVSPPPLSLFLAHLRRRQAMGETVRPPLPDAAETVDAVRILTAHGAKGLEFPVVFMPFLSAGEFPSRAFGSTVPEPPGLREAVADETSQDECLFFVALSRARDHLIVSRSETKNGRALKPSPLLERLQEWRDTQGLADTLWPSGKEDVPAEEASSPPIPDTLPQHSASALEQYQRCPRQYYYAREMGLSGASSDSGYPKFHKGLHDTLTWLRDKHNAGETPGEADLLLELGRVWAERGPVGHRHEARYRETAETMVRAAHARGPEPHAHLAVPLVAHLANCRVRVSPDTVLNGPDGALILARHRTGKVSDTDHRHIRLALMRRAALDTFPNRPVQIALRHLAGGADKEVAGDPPGKRAWEPERLAKYEAAAEGIRLRLFPPTAQGSDLCGQCPFALLCPL